MYVVFDDGDDNYFQWLKNTPDGFVLNLRRGESSSYIVLHRASCRHISTPGREAGAYTEREYLKICAGTVAQLRSAAKQHGREDGSFSNACRDCSPIP